MLKYGEVNPLNVFGLRQLDHCPPHFTKVQFDLKCNVKKITDWVVENYDGRFYAGDSYIEDPKNSRIQMQQCVAFEIPGEASHFALILDKLNTWENNLS
jgi:hypothetical protein